MVKGVKVGPGANWFESAGIGLKIGLWLAPTTLWRSVYKPVAMLIAGIIGLIWNIGYWFVMSVLMIVLGLAGRLRYIDISLEDLEKSLKDD